MNIEQCLKQLTIQEKISLLEGADMGFTNPVPRLGIPKILLADGPHGIRVVKGTDAENEASYTMQGEMYETTALPCEAAMAATWNQELIKETGRYIGEECQDCGAGVILGPGVNGKRSPLGGRNFEYYSEDPYLSGKMAASFINGVQSEGVGTCLKHYVLNDQETRRTSVDVHVEERPLREIYLKPFEIAVREASPWAIMASYNKASGEYLCQNRRLLQDILREEIGFDGVVLSDWSAVKDKVMSHKNGLDLQMPGPSGQIDAMQMAVENGLLTEEEINQRVRHILELVDKVTCNKKSVEIDWNKHHENAIHLIEEGTVLLKNEDAILPLKKGSKIAVVGELAEQPYFTGGGSSSLTPRQLDYPLEYLRKMAEVSYAKGYQGTETNETQIQEAVQIAKDADAVLVFVGFGSTEALDQTTIVVPEAQLLLVHELAKVNGKIVVITQCGSAIEYRHIEADVKAILHAWIPGEGFGSAITNLLFGVSCPSGKLSETFPVSLANTPAYQYFPGYKDNVYYHEGLLTGYRYYDTQEIAPQYPFGFGLSYTEFSYSNLKLSVIGQADERMPVKIRNKEYLQVSVDVTNKGKCLGQEIVQVYVADLESHMFRPKKELKGFTKVMLKPGETRRVEVILDEDAFAYYIPHLNRFAVETGRFEIQVGSSSADIRLKEEIWFESEDDVRMPLTMDDMFGEFLKDDRYETAARDLMNTYGILKGNPFYELFHGASLYQAVELLSYMGVEPERGRKLMEELVGLKN
ncbi:MAG: beta-glucosidase [Oliverpabstia sp.]